MTDKLDKIKNVLEVLNGNVKCGQVKLQNGVAGIKHELKELQGNVTGIKHVLKELQGDVTGIKHVLEKLGAVITQAPPGFAQDSGPGLG